MSATLDQRKPLLESLCAALVAFGRVHPVIHRIALFGSVARGDSTPSSDVDVVVDFMPGSVPRGLAGFAFLDDLESEMAVALDIAVHLITSGSVRAAAKSGNRSLSRAVERDARLVYEAEPAAT